jgi:hypothetical protein
MISRSLFALVVLILVAGCGSSDGDGNSQPNAPADGGSYSDAGNDTDGGENTDSPDGGGTITFDPSKECTALDSAAFGSSGVTLSDTCYYVANEATASQSVTINPGVTVYLAPSTNLAFSGGLTAEGTASSKIRFVAADESSGFGRVSVSGLSKIKYAEFMGGGTGDAPAMLEFYSGSFENRSLLSNVTFDKGQGTACLQLTGTEYVDVESLTFAGCSGTKYVLATSGGLLKHFGDAHTYGASPKFLVLGGSVYENVTFKNMGVLYVVKGELKVQRAVLTVEAGVEIQVDSMDFFTISGGINDTTTKFNAVGTEESPIVFKAGPGGAWRGLNVSGARGTFQYVTIDGARGPKNTSQTIANLTVGGGGFASITNSTLSNSDGYGLFKMSNGSLSASSNKFVNNKLGNELRN